jgi:hypothetical protein
MLVLILMSTFKFDTGIYAQSLLDGLRDQLVSRGSTGDTTYI